MGSSAPNPSPRRAIGLKGIEIYGYVGLFPEERKMGRLFRLNLHLEYTVPRLAQTAPPIDYKEVAELVRQRFTHEGILIEHIAQELAEAILARWENVEKVHIEVHKVHPPIGILAESAYASIEMERARTA
ncbi:MAG: dihydroneopterin aldolase [Bacteroidia bacterium]|nr:dihydroneopterin aldolase [Bacteroidia bacterium]MDW8014544.1 dihydroneopterin aldolase [Bacteroidia bacterium]